MRAPSHRGASPVKRNGDVEAGFSPSRGGRLDWLRYRGVDLVLPPGRVPGFHGETFWPSPQSLWDWPPPTVLDEGPYEVRAESAEAIGMRSGADPTAGVRVEKQYRLLPHGMDVTFTVTNTWPHAHALAPWQVTRAPRAGVLVWAAGDPFTDEDRLVKQREDPGCWYVHARGDAAFPGLATRDGVAAVVVGDVDRTCKLFADARGWVAHVHHGTVLLRVFPDLTPAQAAPRQAELELFFSPERDYLEVENQGAHRMLAPGAARVYPVQVRFATLDPDVPTDRVTPALVAVLASMLGQLGRPPG